MLNPYTEFADIDKTLIKIDRNMPIITYGNVEVAPANGTFATRINNIGEYSLKFCVNAIFNNNPDIDFYDILYLKENKRLIFYTNKAISTEKWRGNKVKNPYKIINDETIKELDMKLNEEKNAELMEDEVSLAFVSTILFREYQKYNDNKKRIVNNLDNKIKQIVSNNRYISYSGITNNEGKLVIQVLDLSKYEEDYLNNLPPLEYEFEKHNGDLCMTKSASTLYNKDILPIMGGDIEELYDFLLDNNNYLTGSEYQIIPIGSGFRVDISYNNLTMYVGRRLRNDSFSIEYHPYSDEYALNCNSLNIVKMINGKEDKIFEKIMIKIDDCPEWLKKLIIQKKEEPPKQKGFFKQALSKLFNIS